MLYDVYKKEYESTPISLKELKAKYELESLPEDSINWQKLPVIEKERTNHNPLVIPGGSTIVVDETKTLQDDVDSAKRLIMANALTILREEVADISIKEFKDIVSIVDTLDDKKKDDTQTNINIQINNMIKEFQDDC